MESILFLPLSPLFENLTAIFYWQSDNQFLHETYRAKQMIPNVPPKGFQDQVSLKIELWLKPAHEIKVSDKRLA